MPTVSICLPVYNGERFLAKAIESALAQTFNDYELLISDDRSQDSSLEIAGDYAGRDPRVKVWSNPQRLGLFANYNACMQRAGGTYIKLFAQDDLLAPRMLESVLAVFADQANVALVSTARLTIDEPGQSRDLPDQLDSTCRLAGHEVIKLCLSKICNWIGEPSAVMFPQALVGSGFDSSFFHSGDLEYWLRIIGDSNYVFLSEPLCSFRRHQAGATDKNMKSLLFAPDMLRLGRIHSRNLDGLGIDHEEYVRRVMEFSMWYVHKMVREEGVTCQESAALDVSDADTTRLLAEFRELSFYALYHGQDELLKAQAAKAESDYHRAAAEERLQKVLNSRTWRATQALKRMVGACSQEPVL